ncbi:PAT family beta-lactamase induction signal transducer AmpG [Pseudoxanthomonas winnipegensis]|nr:PAT family beta-lactamase induction signal transducer AmpG [Pseudoxanthomonas winnipegensis]
MSAAPGGRPVSYKGWRGIKAAFATPSALTMALLGFGSGLPFLLIASQTLSTRLRDVGLQLGEIGLISLASFFYLLKFVWAPLIDRYTLPLLSGLGRRRSWLLAAQVLVAASLFALGAMRPELGVAGLVTWVLVGSFAGATQDAVVDAYRIEIAPESAQAALAATYILGYRIALIVGGAGALYMAEFEDWKIAYFCMAALMLVPIVTTLVSREPVRPEATVVRRIDFFGAFWQPIVGFFTTNGWKLALALLLFVGLFKFPDQVIGVMAGPFYLDSGFTKSDIATVSKLFGIWMSIVGAFGGGMAVAAFGFRRMLLLAALAVGAVQPGLPADGPASRPAMGVLRGAERGQHLAGLRRHRAGGLHVLADRPQLHRHPIRAAGLAGQPAGQVRGRRLGVHRRGHLVFDLLRPERADRDPHAGLACLAVASYQGAFQDSGRTRP